MNWTKFLTYSDSHTEAFETLCNQLFERYLRRTYGERLTKFRVINGSGGDGGIEAYGQLEDEAIIAVQAKWFRQVLGDDEINQIRKSVTTALGLRPSIQEYVICIPHDIHSVRYVRGKKGEPKKSSVNHEENTVDAFCAEIKTAYPDLTLTWWFEDSIEEELQFEEAIQKYWFDKEVISIETLRENFDLQRKSWLHERYVPELHAQGKIHFEYEKLCFKEAYRLSKLTHIRKALSDIQRCRNSISTFKQTEITELNIDKEFDEIESNLFDFSVELSRIEAELQIGNDWMVQRPIDEVDLWSVKLRLKEYEPDNTQRNILSALTGSLDNVHKYELPEYLKGIGKGAKSRVLFVLGVQGTGKTHGLVSCVEEHLAIGCPALLIQAKANAGTNWSEILSKKLELSDWNKEEILSALETAAIRNDARRASDLKEGEEPNYEMSKVLICVDGLDEDPSNIDFWYERMRESEELAKKYPRLRFIYSGRDYIYDSSKVPQSQSFESVSLPREGDVKVSQVAPEYFKEDNFNIQISSYERIRGIDSLLALRLFCEEYEGSVIKDSDQIVTATRDLINLKVNRLNQEFIQLNKLQVGDTRNPILDALLPIAEALYHHHEIEQEKLIPLIENNVSSYLPSSKIDLLLDYLTKNGILFRYCEVQGAGILKVEKYRYGITYQSLVEHIISETVIEDLGEGKINQIPKVFDRHISAADIFDSDALLEQTFDIIPNQRMIENIVSAHFVNTGKLIGDEGFEAENYSAEIIRMLQLKALASAPSAQAVQYKNKVDSFINDGYESLCDALKYLILPSCMYPDGVFGGDYLHDFLISQESVFERDKVWSGLDSFERPKQRSFNEQDMDFNFHETYSIEPGIGEPFLSEWHEYNGEPLIYAWALSTIDQKFRHKLRVALTDWAIKNPLEFRKLLDKIFCCDDPQIHEDLASISLGLAGRLKNVDHLKELAGWTLKNVFSNLEKHRNVVVRQGFRAIVERAFKFGAISEIEVVKARPTKAENLSLLDFEPHPDYDGHGGAYPIVHDLNWYVIEKPYSKFFDYGDNDSPEAKHLLEVYKEKYNIEALYVKYWTVSAAICYMRSNLGFTRTNGNFMTTESHGSKSEVFTYEEKYTWLSVHYLTGYFAENLPLNSRTGSFEYVKDYSQLINVPNPAESVVDLESAGKSLIRNQWVVKEPLSERLGDGNDINERLKDWIEKEPEIDFKNWLSFESSDFQLEEGFSSQKWLSVYTYVGLNTPDDHGNSLLSCYGSLVEKKDFSKLKKLIESQPDNIWFLQHLDHLQSSPDTSTYCNPSDLVWMDWIPEENESCEFYGNEDDEKLLYHGSVKLTKHDIEGEHGFVLPSKFVRSLIGASELEGNRLFDSTETLVGFNYDVNVGSFKEHQEFVLVNKDVLSKALVTKKMIFVWIAQLYRSNNPYIEDKSIEHCQKTRKYLVWQEGGKFKHFKFWDERFSNQRG